MSNVELTAEKASGGQGQVSILKLDGESFRRVILDLYSEGGAEDLVRARVRKVSPGLSLRERKDDGNPVMHHKLSDRPSGCTSDREVALLATKYNHLVARALTVSR